MWLFDSEVLLWATITEHMQLCQSGLILSIPQTEKNVLLCDGYFCDVY